MHCYLRYKNRIIDITFPENSVSLELIEEEKIEPEHLENYKVKKHKQFIENWLPKHTIQHGANFQNSRIMYKTTGKIVESEILLYTTPNGDVRIDVLYQGESIWLTQKKMAELFGVQPPAISKHVKNIFESGELQEEAVIVI